jgi:hypothetical protein
MATGLEKWSRSKFNYPTGTAVNGIHETTVQAGCDVTAVTAFILPVDLPSIHPAEVVKFVTLTSHSLGFVLERWFNLKGWDRQEERSRHILSQTVRCVGLAGVSRIPLDSPCCKFRYCRTTFLVRPMPFRDKFGDLHVQNVA